MFAKIKAWFSRVEAAEVARLKSDVADLKAKIKALETKIAGKLPRK